MTFSASLAARCGFVTEVPSMVWKAEFCGSPEKYCIMVLFCETEITSISCKLLLF